MRSLKLRMALVAASLACSLSFAAHSAPASPKPTAAGVVQPANPEGRYRRTSPSYAELVIKPVGQNWRVEIVAAGIPNGSATAADCTSVALGSLAGDRIIAHLVPFRTDVAEVSAEDLAGDSNRLVLRLAATAVEVVTSDGERFCGVGSVLTGVYRKVR